MPSSFYTINKGANKPVVFKGLKAQYIWYLGGGLVLLLIIFAIMYFVGVNNYVCIVIIVILGSVLIANTYRLSHRYGEHGMMKKIAKRSVPKVIKSRSRKDYIRLKK